MKQTLAKPVRKPVKGQAGNGCFAAAIPARKLTKLTLRRGGTPPAEALPGSAEPSHSGRAPTRACQQHDRRNPICIQQGRQLAFGLLLLSVHFGKTILVKNIQIIDGALNATFSVFQATEEEFAAIFPNGQDMEFIEDCIARLGSTKVGSILSLIWERPILKREAHGIHGTLYYQWSDRRAYLPVTKREVDWEDSAINEAQRRLFRSNRQNSASHLQRSPAADGDDPGCGPR